MTGALWGMAFLWPLTLVAAIAGAGLSPHRGAAARQVLVRLAPLAAIPFLLLALLPGTMDRPVQLPWALFGLSWGLDPVARPLVLTGALLYGVALAAVAWSRTTPGGGAPALTAFLLVSFAGNMGVHTAGDAVTFYLSFTAMSFAAYGLVLHHRTAQARRAGRIYLVLTMLSESAILAALLLITAAGGARLADAPAATAASPHLHWIVGLLLVGFGVKAGTLPLHVWLPLAHPAAPPAASAVLSGAMVKAGLMGWLRFMPLGETALPAWGTALVLLALAGAFLAVPVGAVQSNPKVVLAYSTISQMGFLAAVVGVGLAAPELAAACISAAVVYSVHHGFAKGVLFLGVPIWQHFGAGRTRPVAVLGLVVASLAVAGAPLSSGSVSKYAAKTAVEGAALFGVELAQLLPYVATGSTLLLLRFGQLLLRAQHTPADPPHTELWAWLAVVLTGIAVPWALTTRWVPLAAVPGLEVVTLWDAAWPIVLGLGLGAVWWWLTRRHTLTADGPRSAEPAVPPGDLIVLDEALLRRTGQGAERIRARAVQAGQSARHRVGQALPHQQQLVEAVRAAAGQAHSWSGSGLAVLLIIAGLALALLGAGR